MKILVTSAEWQATLAIVQSLGRKGHQVWIFDYNITLPVSFSKYCAGIITSPQEYDSHNYFNSLLHEITENNYDYLIPISDAVMDIIIPNQTIIKEKVKILLPDVEAYKVARDKGKTMKFALKHLIPIPKSYFPTCVEELNEIINELSYPIVVKIPRSTANHGVFILGSAQELRNFFSEREFSVDNYPFIQDFVDGDLWDLTAICIDGKSILHFTFGCYQKYLVGGTPPYMFTVKDERLIQYAETLFKELNWHGPIDLDFIVSKNNEIYLLEINPRFAGGIHFAYKIGIDFPHAYLNSFNTDNINPQKVTKRIVFRTFFPSEIVWLRKSWKNYLTALTMGWKNKTKNDLYLDDPRLLIKQLKYYRKKK